MAIYAQPCPINQTLTTTVADNLVIQPGNKGAETSVILINRDATNTLWYRLDATAPVAADQNSMPILPSQSRTLRFYPTNVGSSASVSVVGSGGAYSVCSGNNVGGTS